ncbi:hypothetical protein [Alteribacter natronophilus]|uniref:hypothetical protein n=1 Tax=Alteribacter natronophilus TaxID=2583810 RepID=UPI001AEED772|nr:hypothetical protein [Alteribacter natronophilus]
MDNDQRQFQVGGFTIGLPGFGQPATGFQQFGPGGYGPPAGPPPGGPGQQQGFAGPPSGPPPATPPSPQSFSAGPAALGGAGGPAALAVDPGALFGCLFRYTYIILETGQRFWFYPVFIGRTSVAGWRWRPRQFRWVYTGFDTRLIRSFSC